MLKALSLRTYGAIAFIFFILWLPKDWEDRGQAAAVWLRWLALLDRELLLWTFSLSLLTWLIWTDLRPYFRLRRNRKTAEWAEGRTRLTIREAACLVVGISPQSFDQSGEAQSIAREMLYWAGSGLLWPAELTVTQHQNWRHSSKMPEGFRATLDTFLTREELEKYRAPGWKTWLPILDAQHKERR